MTRRLAVRILESTLGSDRARSILGDLDEELARGRGSGRASHLCGLWLLGQALAYVTADRWARRDRGPSGFSRSRTLMELSTMWYDIRHAIRSLLSAPTFTIVALLVLALGIGASTAIFSVVDAVVLRGLPYDESDRLVQVGTLDPRTAAYGDYQPPQNFADWQARQDLFVAMAAATVAGGFTINENGVPTDLLTLQVTAGYFDVYRAYPQLGQPLTKAHEVESRTASRRWSTAWRDCARGLR